MNLFYFYFYFCVRLPDGWPARLNVMDEIWVPTQFHRNIFEANHVPSHKLQVNSFFKELFFCCVCCGNSNPKPQLV